MMGTILILKGKKMNATLQTGKLAHTSNTKQYVLKAGTLIEVLQQRTLKNDNFLRFMDIRNQEHAVTANDVLNGAQAVARYLLSKGLIKNDKVVIMLPTSKEFACIYFGILMAGGIPVPVSQPAGTSNIEKYLDNMIHIINDSEARFFITYEKIRSIAGSLMNIPNLKNGFLFENEIFENPVPEDEYCELPEIKTDDLALIQYTSGTTGKPKGVMLSHNNLLHNIHGIGVGIDVQDSDCAISWLPMYHDMGLIGGFFTAMYWRVSAIYMLPEAFLFRPQWWLENISRYKATISVAPNFGYHYCLTRIPDTALQDLDLSSWRIAFNGAEPVDRITLSKFLEKFKSCGLRDNTFFPVYGMAENSLAATFPNLDITTVVRRFNRAALEDDFTAIDSESDNTKEYIDLVSVGYPLLGQEIRIVDENGETLMERQVGEILVKSMSLTSGYYKNERDTEQTIKDGWLYSGDLGFILDGMLFISGRKKEMIIKRGKNIYPYDVERIASTVKGVRLGCVAAFAIHNESMGTEDLVLVCESAIKDREEIERLKRNINNEVLAKLGISLDDIEIVPKGIIPKTTSGKTQRVLCKKIYLEDQLMPNRSRNFFILAKTMVSSQIYLLRKKFMDYV